MRPCQQVGRGGTMQFVNDAAKMEILLPQVRALGWRGLGHIRTHTPHTLSLTHTHPLSLSLSLSHTHTHIHAITECTLMCYVFSMTVKYIIIRIIQWIIQ